MDSGIYIITNNINSKSYVGLSKNIKPRWQNHKSDLSKNKHCNKYLQAAWNKYGKSAFSFSILEFCNEEELGIKEEYFIKKYSTYENGYNLTPGGEYQFSGKNNGRYNNTKYTFYHLDGRIEKNISCWDFSKKHNVPGAYGVVCGLRSLSKGWVIDQSLVSIKTPKKYIFYNLDGTVTTKLTQAEFNTKYNLNSDTSVSGLVSGKIKRYKTWFFSKENLKEHVDRRKNKLKTVINDKGKIIPNLTLKEFQKLTKCNNSSASVLFTNKRKIVKNWRLYTGDLDYVFDYKELKETIQLTLQLNKSYLLNEVYSILTEIFDQFHIAKIGNIKTLREFTEFKRSNSKYKIIKFK